jgi:hypothetical protein
VTARAVIGPRSLRRWTGTLGLAAVGALLLIAGCGSSRIVLPITIEPERLDTPLTDAALTSHEAAVRGIAAIMAKDLGLPVPAHVTVYVYSSRDVFEQGLIRDAHVSPVRAAELSDFAIGIGKRRQLLLNDDAPKGREWLRLIAHELAHVSQIELAQGEGRAEQWLAEGMAEWVAFTVLERLGLDTLQTRRRLSGNGIRDHVAVTAAHLDLETLGTPRGFTVRHLREGSLRTYQLAFVMADYLITRDGLPRVIEYFRAFASRPDRHDNFVSAFGQSLEQFEQEVLSELHALGH